MHASTNFHRPATFFLAALMALVIVPLTACGGGGDGDDGTLPPPPVNQVPTASFVASPLSGTAPLLVSFDASASSDPDGSIAAYAWTFGDGATATGRTAAHSYVAAGTYAARLTVTDDDGATASGSQDILVTSGTTPPPGNQTPTASFTAAPLSGTAPLLVSFDASASSDSDGAIAAYLWTFGDGGTASGPTAAHTYAVGGTYTAQLTVTDDDGATANASRDISVTSGTTPPPVNQAPTAAFTASPLSGTAPLPVSFDASASSDPDGSIAEFAWTFGDGGTASGPTAAHTYAVAGTFTARLTVTDDDGTTASASRNIVVTSETTPPPNAQWLGRYESSLIPEAPVYAEIVQNGTALSGTFRDDTGRTGTLAGVISDTTATLTITETTPDCAGSFIGTGTLGNVAGLESIDFVFTGNDCLGTHTGGTGLLIRQTGYVLAWGQNEPTSLVHNNGELFWTDRSAGPLKKLDLASGETEVLAPRMRALTRMTVEPDRLLWIDAIGDSNAYCTGIGVQQALMVSNIDGSNVRMLAEGPACGGTVAPVSDGTYAYWVTSRTGTNAWMIERIPLAGGPAWEVRTADGFTSITSLATDNERLYWIEDAAPDYGYVRRCSFDACGYLMQTPFTGIYIDMATNLVLTGDQIVFGARRYATPSDRIIKVPKTGSAGTDIAVAPDFPVALVTDGTTVFWTDASALHSVPLAGGATTTLASDRPLSGGLSVDSIRVAWTERPTGAAFSGTIRAVPKSGGAITTLVANAASPRALAPIGGSDLIYADGVIDFLPSSVSGIHRRAAAGSITTLVSGVSGPGPIAVDATSVYISEGWWIKRVPRAGGAASILSQASFYITSIDIDGTHVYWVEDDLGTVRKAPLGGGTATFLGSGNGRPFDLRVNGGFVYWLLGLDRLLRVPTAGGPVETLAGSLLAAEALAVDASSAFFTESDAGRVSRIAATGGSVEPIGGIAGGQAWYALTQDADRLYWLTPLAVGGIAKDGSMSTTIMGAPLSDLGVRGSVAVDDDYVYWAETLIGAIKRAPK